MLRRMLPPLLALVLVALQAPLPGPRPATATRSCCALPACCARGMCAQDGSCPMARAARHASAPVAGATRPGTGPCYEAGRCGGAPASLAPPTLDPWLPIVVSGAPVPASGSDTAVVPSPRFEHPAEEPLAPPPRA